MKKSPLKLQAKAIVPTDWGKFEMMAYSNYENDWMPHLALVHEKTNFQEPVLVRFHSECITGDIFHSHRCECGKQLHKALDLISERGGILIYLRQEGRGIGIINKLKAYTLQDEGKNTVEANLALGLPADARDFEDAISILKDIGVHSILLLTNNPEKQKIVEQNLSEVKRIPLQIKATLENYDYLKTKRDFFGHVLELE